MSGALVFSAGLAPDDAEGLAVLRAQGRRLVRLYPAWYAAGGEARPGVHSLADAAQRAAVSALCAEAGVELWPCLYARSLAEWPASLAPGAAGSALWEALRADGAKGLCLDPGTLPDDEDGVALLGAVFGALKEALGEKGLGLALVARFGELAPSAPTTGDKGSSGSGDSAAAAVPDASAWAEACDLLRVPLFQEPSPATAPGPLAPKAWLDAALGRFARADARKLEAVLPAVGRDWAADGSGPRDLPFAAWAGLVAAHPPERRDPASREVFVTAGGRAAWTNDAISLSAKLWEARQRGFSQASLQRLGPEDPRWWAFLDTLPEAF